MLQKYTKYTLHIASTYIYSSGPKGVDHKLESTLSNADKAVAGHQDDEHPANGRTMAEDDAPKMEERVEPDVYREAGSTGNDVYPLRRPVELGLVGPSGRNQQDGTSRTEPAGRDQQDGTSPTGGAPL